MITSNCRECRNGRTLLNRGIKLENLNKGIQRYRNSREKEKLKSASISMNPPIQNSKRSDRVTFVHPLSNNVRIL